MKRFIFLLLVFLSIPLAAETLDDLLSTASEEVGLVESAAYHGHRVQLGLDEESEHALVEIISYIKVMHAQNPKALDNVRKSKLTAYLKKIDAIYKKGAASTAPDRYLTMYRKISGVIRLIVDEVLLT